MKARSFLIYVGIMLLFSMVACKSSDNSVINDEETYPECAGELAIIYSDLTEIIADAQSIVKVSVEKQSVVDLDGYPQTHTAVTVQNCYKGNLKTGSSIEVIEEGGIDGKVMGGIPQLSKENEYFLFLTEYNGSYYICGAFQGRFIIKDDCVYQQATKDVKLAYYKPLSTEEFSKSLSPKQ